MYMNKDIDYIKYLKDKEIIIFGAGNIGKKGYARLKGYGYPIVAFCDNDEKKQDQVLFGIKIISIEELKKINNDQIVIILCSNYEREIRYQLYDQNIYNFISISQIDFGGGEEYYDEQYFAFQQQLGKFGGKVKAPMFRPYINEDMVIVEFGSGGGYLLNNLDAKEKIGIEINDTAREEAKRIGIRSVKYIDDIPDNYADAIISSSVLEHVESPLMALKQLRNKLKDGGKAIFYVPNESCNTEYQRSEINNHLYTWNCLTLGNLFKAAGYFVYSVKKVQEAWPKHYSKIEQQVSYELFEAICEIGGRAFDENRCMIVAIK